MLTLKHNTEIHLVRDYTRPQDGVIFCRVKNLCRQTGSSLDVLMIQKRDIRGLEL